MGSSAVSRASTKNGRQPARLSAISLPAFALIFTTGGLFYREGHKFIVHSSKTPTRAATRNRPVPGPVLPTARSLREACQGPTRRPDTDAANRARQSAPGPLTSTSPLRRAALVRTLGPPSSPPRPLFLPSRAPPAPPTTAPYLATSSPRANRLHVSLHRRHIAPLALRRTPLPLPLNQHLKLPAAPCNRPPHVHYPPHPPQPTAPCAASRQIILIPTTNSYRNDSCNL